MKSRYYLLAAVAASAVATPAMARDGQGYAGIEGGVTWVKAPDADVFVDFTTVNTPPGVIGTPAGPADASFDNAFDLDSKMGYELGIYGGYDFGMFRLEGEVAWKHAKLDDFSVDTPLLDAINNFSDLDLVDEDFDIDDNVGALAFMVNALVDFGDDDGFSFQAGVGAGWAKVKMFDEKDGAFAWQAILGVNYAISPNIDLGLRYKYFSTGKVDLSDEDVAFNTLVFQRQVIVTPPGGLPQGVTQTTTANIFSDLDSKFRSHSLLATLTFNFGGEPPPPPP
ncbi:MAG: outer membrane protein, partial [Sphingomicrobium sp.]